MSIVHPYSGGLEKIQNNKKNPVFFLQIDSVHYNAHPPDLMRKPLHQEARRMKKDYDEEEEEDIDWYKTAKRLMRENELLCLRLNAAALSCD